MTSLIKEAIKDFRRSDKAEAKTTPNTKYSDKETHLACTWQGTKSMAVKEKPKPMITEPTDAIVAIHTTTICGSDLHMYNNNIPGLVVMGKGDIVGHEAIGVVESVGSNVKNVKSGDRVVISAVIACGDCEYCKQGQFSCCDKTNTSHQMEEIFGHNTSALFGYSRLAGGYDGLQAEYARVPFADVNLLKIDSDSSLSSEQLITLSDIACTGWHANELGEVSERQHVAIWGAGPVGLMAAMWAKFRGASRVCLIDNDEFRLNLAKKKLDVETLNFGQVKDVKEKLFEMFPEGFDVCIDCVGFNAPTSFVHKFEKALRLETDSLDIIDQMSYVTRKCGRMVLIGDYFGYGNHFPIGRVMEKSLIMSGGQVFVQNYWKKLLGYIKDKKVDPSFVVTHRLPFDKIADAYKTFNEHEDNAIKMVFNTKAGSIH